MLLSSLHPDSSDLLKKKIVPDCPEGYFIHIKLFDYELSKHELEYYVGLQLQFCASNGRACTSGTGSFVANPKTFGETTEEIAKKIEKWIAYPFFHGSKIKSFAYLAPPSK